MADNFCDYLSKTLRFSEQTCFKYNADAHRFIKHLKQRRLSPQRVTQKHIKHYLSVLQKDRPLTGKTLARHLKSIEHYYSYLQITGEILVSPMLNFEYPKHYQKQHRFYSVEEITSLIEAPDTSTLIGIRDRAILEVLYDTGLRRSELVSLKLYDVDFVQGVLIVHGKGSKERIVPLNQMANKWLNHYLNVRDKLLNGKISEYVFISQLGKSITKHALYERVKHYVRQAGLDDSISPHTLRHAFATHMLQNGANMEVIRDLLGHESIQTTQIYTQLENERLKQMHRKHHPRA